MRQTYEVRPVTNSFGWHLSYDAANPEDPAGTPPIANKGTLTALRTLMTLSGYEETARSKIKFPEK